MTTAIKNKNTTCMKCLGEFEKLNRYSIYGRGYGSSFDNVSTTLQVCNDCDLPELQDWFDEQLEMDDYCENYTYEDKIKEFVDSLPLEGNELFYNTFHSSSGWSMDAQDWIDIKLGIAPDELYEEYGMYSPSQRKAYKERFPTCENPVNVTYNDGSKGCWCPFGASGKYGQEDSVNISKECNGCTLYKLRETPIKEMNRNTYKKYEEYMRGMRHKHLFE